MFFHGEDLCLPNIFDLLLSGSFLFIWCCQRQSVSFYSLVAVRLHICLYVQTLLMNFDEPSITTGMWGQSANMLRFTRMIKSERERTTHCFRCNILISWFDMTWGGGVIRGWWVDSVLARQINYSFFHLLSLLFFQHTCPFPLSCQFNIACDLLSCPERPAALSAPDKWHYQTISHFHSSTLHSISISEAEIYDLYCDKFNLRPSRIPNSSLYRN